MDLGIGGRPAAGAASPAGLGFASAQALAAEGVRVALCSRDEGRVRAAAERVGGDAVPLVADLSSAEAGAAFVEAAIAALGHVDILVANAGGPPPGLPSGTDLEAYRAALDLNLLSTVAMCNAAVPAMRERGWGRVVAITSSGARSPISFLAASSTARAGVTGFLKVLANEVAPHGITVNSIQPGMHATDRVTSLGGNLDEMAKRIPVGFIGSAEDFGKAIAFLCSVPARYITGTGLLVDGGAFSGLS